MANRMSLDPMILGVNPFAGVSHFSGQRAREKSAVTTPNDISQVMRHSFDAGATGFNVAVDDRGYELLKILSEIRTPHEIGIYALVPDTKKYVTAQLSKGTFGMISDVLAELDWGARMKTVVQGGLALLTSDPLRAVKTYLDVELKKLRQRLPSNTRLVAVLAHEAVTDTAIAIGAAEVLRTYISHVIDRGVTPGFVTRNFPRFVEFCQVEGLPIREAVIMTPFNKIGFQMTPSREQAEKVLHNHGLNVIAMSIMAGGQIPLVDAIDYVGSLNLESVTVGVSSPSQADETFTALAKAMRRSLT